jgi:hypothetical protein
MNHLSTGLRRAAVVGIAGFFGCAAVATALQPSSYDSFRDYISGLAALDASYPSVMMTGFQLGAVGLISAALLLFRLLPSIAGRIGATLVFIAGAALGVAGFARFDCGHTDAACQAQLEAGMSFQSHLHGLAALLAFLPLVIAGFSLAVAVWRSKSRYRNKLGPLVLLWALSQLALTMTVEEHLVSPVGLLHRLDLLLLLGLPLLVAVGRWGFASATDVEERRAVSA